MGGASVVSNILQMEPLGVDTVGAMSDYTLTLDEVRLVLLWICDRLLIDPGDERCDRCGHSGYFHRLDDSLDVAPTNPAAKFRCIFPMPGGPTVPLCVCPSFIEPPTAEVGGKIEQCRTHGQRCEEYDYYQCDLTFVTSVEVTQAAVVKLDQDSQ